MQGNLRSLQYNGETVTLVMDITAFDDIHKLVNKQIEVKEVDKKRSLDANRYAWEMIGKIASKMNLPKEEVYRGLVKDYGISRDHWVLETEEKFQKTAWSQLGLGWFTERVDFQEDRVLLRYYYGTSRYNKRMMTRFIDGIVQECNQLEINTDSEQIKSLLNDMK